MCILAVAILQGKLSQGILFGVVGVMSFGFLVVLCKWCQVYQQRRRRAQQSNGKTNYQTYQITHTTPAKFSKNPYGSGKGVQPGLNERDIEVGYRH